jgi:putative ABC transport system ATP-binding protein
VSLSENGDIVMGTGDLKGKETETILRLEKIYKTYGHDAHKVLALREIDLTINKGDFVGIIGPSGSGKSTLLRIMGLLDNPTSGKVFIGGFDASMLTELEQARIRGKKVGFVFQSFNLVPTFTALENVELPMAIYDVPADERRAKATKLLEKLGLGQRLDHRPGELSGGERQRVAIARALINDPEIILADEPTGNLDSKTGKEMLGIMKSLHEEGKTIVLITHDESVVRLTQRMVRIKDGKIVKIEA